MTDLDTRLRVTRGFGKDETEASTKAFESLRPEASREAPPPLASNGWGGIGEAMLGV